MKKYDKFEVGKIYKIDTTETNLWIPDQNVINQISTNWEEEWKTVMIFKVTDIRKGPYLQEFKGSLYENKSKIIIFYKPILGYSGDDIYNERCYFGINSYMDVNSFKIEFDDEQ